MHVFSSQTSNRWVMFRKAVSFMWYCTIRLNSIINTISFERGPRSERVLGPRARARQGLQIEASMRARADPGPHSPRGPLSREILLETRLFVSFFGSKKQSCLAPWKDQPPWWQHLLLCADQLRLQCYQAHQTRARWLSLSWSVFFQRGSWKMHKAKPIRSTVASCAMNGLLKKTAMRPSRWSMQLESSLLLNYHSLFLSTRVCLPCANLSISHG